MTFAALLLAGVIWQLPMAKPVPVRCPQLPRALVIRTTSEHSTTHRANICRASQLVLQSFRGDTRNDDKAAWDSLHVVYHEFPVLGSAATRQVYQVGAYARGGHYREAAVDRRSWRVEPVERDRE